MKLTNKNDIHVWLTEQGIEKCSIKDDLTVVCLGGFIIKDENVKVLPIKFDIVGGDIEITHGQLTSFEGFPTFVAGNVVVSGNELTSFEYAPKVIRGNFDCSNNKITSLKGMSKVMGSFNAKYNQIETMEGCHEVTGEINLSYNKLKSLRGCPAILHNNLLCHNNELETLLYAPRKVEGDFVCDDNHLKDLNHGPKYVSGSYCVTNNALISLLGLPEELGDDLFISGNQLENLLHCPKKLQRLYAKNNPLNSFEYLPEKFISISFSTFKDEFSKRNHFYQQHNKDLKHNKDVIKLSEQEIRNTWHAYKTTKLYEKMQQELPNHNASTRLKI